VSERACAGLLPDTFCTLGVASVTLNNARIHFHTYLQPACAAWPQGLPPHRRKLANFDRERIPGRVVRTRAAYHKGFFGAFPLHCSYAVACLLYSVSSSDKRSQLRCAIFRTAVWRLRLSSVLCDRNTILACAGWSIFTDPSDTPVDWRIRRGVLETYVCASRCCCVRDPEQQTRQLLLLGRATFCHQPCRACGHIHAQSGRPTDWYNQPPYAFTHTHTRTHAHAHTQVTHDILCAHVNADFLPRPWMQTPIGVPSHGGVRLVEASGVSIENRTSVGSWLLV
jgi:hypothetical protein